MRRYLFPTLALAIIAGCLALVSFLWPVERVTVWVDRATGTTRTLTERAFEADRVDLDHSPLEARLKEVEDPFAYDWAPGSRITRDIWGRQRWVYGEPECPGAAFRPAEMVPALHLHPDNLAVYAEVATDDEVRRFAHTARSGTVEERVVAVQRATHVWFMDMQRNNRLQSPSPEYRQTRAQFEAEQGPIAEAMRP